MSTSIAAIDAEFLALRQRSEEVKNDSLQVLGELSFFEMQAQGDIGLVFLDKVPEQWKLNEAPELQLAPGNTQGSRHCLDRLEGLTLYKAETGNPLDGPVIQADRAFVVNHPEHGDIQCPAGTWGVIYQRAYADDLRRIQD